MSDVGARVSTRAYAIGRLMPGARTAPCTTSREEDELDDLMGSGAMGKTSFTDLMRVATTSKELQRQWWIVDPRLVGWWDAITSLALLFTALVTPFEVSYLPPPESARDGLFVINRPVT